MFKVLLHAITILPFPFSSTFGSMGEKYYPCQILSCNSNGKLNYFKGNFHIWFAAISQFKNAHEPQGELG